MILKAAWIALLKADTEKLFHPASLFGFSGLKMSASKQSGGYDDPSANTMDGTRTWCPPCQKIT
jgi:hypothetical protein